MMHIHFNHHISCLCDIIEMIGLAHPDVTVSASHARSDHGLDAVLTRVTPELPACADGSMPEGYTTWLINAANIEHADIVIPYRHRHALSAHKEEFTQAGLRLLTCGTHEVMFLVEDKTKLLRKAQTLGIRISPFQDWEDAEGLESSLKHFASGAEVGGQLCIKPAHGIYGEGFKILFDEQAENAFAIAVKDQRPHMSVQALKRIVKDAATLPRMMTMPFLPGRERSVDFACLEGRLLGAVTREKNGPMQHVGHNSEAASIAELLVSALGLSGLANLQTLEGADGLQYLLEVNSRAAGGIGMTAFSGVNLPGILISALKGYMPDEPVYPTQKIGVMRRKIYSRV